MKPPIYLSFPNMVTVLDNKSVDAAFLSEPGVTAVQENKSAVRLMGDDEMFPYHQVAVTMYSARFIERERDAAIRFMKAFLRGTRDYVDTVKDGRLSGPGSDAIVAILTEYSMLKDAALYRRITVHGCDPDGRVNLESLVADLAFFRAEGLIQGKVEAADAVDSTIADAAVRELGAYPREWRPVKK